MKTRADLMKKRIFLISIIVFSSLVGVGQAKSDYVAGDNAALVSAELIQEAGWTHNWQMNLPLKPGE
jgi:hypothetical protein